MTEEHREKLRIAHKISLKKYPHMQDGLILGRYRKKSEEEKSRTGKKIALANIGSKLTDEHKANIGRAGRGKKHSAEWSRNISLALTGKRYPEKSGPNHHNWKGGSRGRRGTGNEADCKAWTKSVFEKDNYVCQKCKEAFNDFHAHHIKSWIDYSNLRYDVNNGITVCRACHYYITFNRTMPEGSKWGKTKRVYRDRNKALIKVT